MKCHELNEKPLFEKLPIVFKKCLCRFIHTYPKIFCFFQVKVFLLDGDAEVNVVVPGYPSAPPEVFGNKNEFTSDRCILCLCIQNVPVVTKKASGFQEGGDVVLAAKLLKKIICIPHTL